MSSDRSRPAADQVLAALNAPGGTAAPPAVAPAAGSTSDPDSTAAPKPSTARAAATVNVGGQRHGDEGSIKETIESILVAFVLAFIFRAFVVEAFVIPTGSMAPTLLGAHMRFTCDDCGYRFDVNYTGRPIGDDVEIPSVAQGKVFSLHCPNCGLKVARENPKNAQDENDATNPTVHYGDRILVLKYAYLLDAPDRWDVVVFKTPDRSDDERRQMVPPYTVNYIKRLIGRPGESVFILDGDIYAGAHDADLASHVVQTKTEAAQQALWRIVFDNDYLPTREGWTEPWVEDRPGSGWSVGGGPGGGEEGSRPARVLRFDGDASGPGWLQFNPDADPGKQAFTDWLAYAATKHTGAGDSYDHRGLVGRNNVSDVKLSLFYERRSGDGPLRLELTKLGETFTAELTPGKVRLLRQSEKGGEGPTELASAPLPDAGTRPLRLEFMNVDYRVSLRVDGREVLATTPEQYRPDLDALLQAWRRKQTLPKPKVRIGAESQVSALSHVSLWRDVYYTNYDHESYASDIKWGIPSRPVKLGPGEYWVLGDNSLMSGDGRYWGLPVELPDEHLPYVQPGVVPERFMLGKAFFVYWPAGYRLTPSSPGIVPNFGDMRFIH